MLKIVPGHTLRIAHLSKFSTYFLTEKFHRKTSILERQFCCFLPDPYGDFCKGDRQDNWKISQRNKMMRFRSVLWLWKQKAGIQNVLYFTPSVKMWWWDSPWLMPSVSWAPKGDRHSHRLGYETTNFITSLWNCVHKGSKEREMKMAAALPKRSEENL